MAVLLLFIGLLGVLAVSFSRDNMRLSLIKGVLLFSLLVLITTETTSLFESLNYASLTWCWGVIDFALILLLFKKRPFGISSVKLKMKYIWSSLKGWEKILIGFSVFILVGIFIQGIVYPTNNWDSMAYHMARVIHWIQNESLAHYRTTVYPQVNSPPFAEQLILTINLLAGNDYFSNSVQLFYLVATAIPLSLVAKQLGLNRFGQILSVFIMICIPEVILLASSTHTELVVSFFMVAGIYFMIRTAKKQHWMDIVLLGLCLGLAATTKATVFIYLAPFVLIWGAYHCYQMVSRKKPIKLFYFLLVGSIFVVINSGHYTRNYRLTGSIFGAQQEVQNYYVNEEHSVKMMISNVTRHISSQFGFPRIAPVVEGWIEDLHDQIGVDPDDQKITTHDYTIDPLATHENNGSNIYHAILMFLSLCWIVVFMRKQNSGMNLYWMAIVLSFLLFCFYLKWQPWAKLHAPFFIFYSIVLAHFLIKTIRPKLLFGVVVLGFVTYAMAILLFNWSRPFITYPPFTSKIKITDNRYQKYFSRFLRYHDDYKVVSSKIATNNLENIGLNFEEYDMEYQLFLGSYRNNVKPIHLNAHKISSKLPVRGPIDCIVSTRYDHLIEYNGETYYNVTKDNDGYLYLFLKK